MTNIAQATTSLFPYFGEQEVHRLPHLARARILSRLENCSRDISQQDEIDEATLDEVARLVSLFTIVGEFTSDPFERSRIISDTVHWENWIQSKGRIADITRLRPYRSRAHESDGSNPRRSYGTVDKDSVRDVLNDLSNGQNTRDIVFDSIDFSDFNRGNPGLLGKAFEGGLIIDCEFRDCNFTGVKIPKARLVRVDFNGCHLQQVEMKGLRAHDIRIRDPRDMTEAKFEEAVFFKVSFDDIANTDRDRVGRLEITESLDFNKAVFVDCLFEKVRFVQAKFPSASFVQCIVEDAEFEGCDLEGSVIHDTNFISCLFNGGSLRETLFNECNLAGIQLKKGTRHGGRTGEIDPILDGLDCKMSFDLPSVLWDRLSEEDRTLMQSHEDIDWAKDALAILSNEDRLAELAQHSLKSLWTED